MENKNIVFNYTLEQYNKKYRNRRYRLLKYTKKQLEDFDKEYGHYVFNGKTHTLEFNKYLLKDRKWALIGDTYYEIPKPVRFTWFRNLSAGVQACCCLLGAGAVTSAVVFPALAATVWNKGGNTPEVDTRKWYEKENWYDFTNKAATEDIGRTCNLKIDSLEYSARLIGIDHDDLTDGSGKAHTTWELSTFLCKEDKTRQSYKWNAVEAINRKYSECTIFTMLNDETSGIISKLPSGLKNNIKQVKKSVAQEETAGQGYTEYKFDCKMFSLSCLEMKFNTGESTDFGTVYSYYDINDETELKTRRVKKALNGGSGQPYWLRSPRTQTNTSAWHVLTNGDYSYGNVNQSTLGVAPAFCL